MNTNNRGNAGEPVRSQNRRPAPSGGVYRNGATGPSLRPTAAAQGTDASSYKANPARNAERNVYNRAEVRRVSGNPHSSVQNGMGAGCPVSHSDANNSIGSTRCSSPRRVQRSASAKNNPKRYEFDPVVIAVTVIAVILAIILSAILINHFVNKGKDNGVQVGTNETGNALSNENSLLDTSELYFLDVSEVIVEAGFPLIKVFDEEGRVLSAPVRKENGDIEGNIVYVYGVDGNLVSEMKYDLEGKLISKRVTGGIKDGVFLTVYEPEFDAHNNYSGYTETFLDENGGTIEKLKYSSDGVIENKITK